MTHQLLLVESLLATVHIITESSQPVVQHLHVAVQDRTLTQVVKLKQKHNRTDQGWKSGHFLTISGRKW